MISSAPSFVNAFLPLRQQRALQLAHGEVLVILSANRVYNGPISTYCRPAIWTGVDRS
jgi:hypothetical protein